MNGCLTWTMDDQRPGHTIQENGAGPNRVYGTYKCMGMLWPLTIGTSRIPEGKKSYKKSSKPSFTLHFPCVYGPIWYHPFPCRCEQHRSSSSDYRYILRGHSDIAPCRFCDALSSLTGARIVFGWPTPKSVWQAALFRRKWRIYVVCLASALDLTQACALSGGEWPATMDRSPLSAWPLFAVP